MPLSFLPTMITDAITDLKPDLLQEKGIQLLMMDFDNTIVPYTTDDASLAVFDWIQMMRSAGIKLCVVSNSHNDRVKIFCSKYGIDCITHAKKPFPRGIQECLDQYGMAPAECALVGDQIYTDVLGANGCGVRSILVKAIHNHNFWLKARHVLEMPFIYAARKRRI